MEVGVEVGGDSVNRVAAFVGPKDMDLLRRVDPKLQQLIDWGWFGVIAKPLFLAMHWLNDNWFAATVGRSFSSPWSSTCSCCRCASPA